MFSTIIVLLCSDVLGQSPHLQIFGLSPDSWLIRCLSVPLALCTSLTLSPLAAISHLLFKRTLNFLTFIHANEKYALK